MEDAANTTKFVVGVYALVVTCFSLKVIDENLKAARRQERSKLIFEALRVAIDLYETSQKKKRRTIRRETEPRYFY